VRTLSKSGRDQTDVESASAVQGLLDLYTFIPATIALAVNLDRSSCNEHKRGMRQVLKVKSQIGIRSNEMADNLANEAADECCLGRHYGYDLSTDYTQPFRDKYWLQQTILLQTAGWPANTRACLRNLDDSLRSFAW